MSGVPPTRQNQQIFKGKKKAAEGGHRLLKKKADALKVKFRDYAKAIAATKGSMAADSKDAFFSLTQAEYAAGAGFKRDVKEGMMTATVRVGAGVDNVAGVKLPVFTKIDTGADSGDHLGLAGGGKKIGACAGKFEVLLEALIKLASLQTSFVTLDEAMKVTNRRVNALENVTIPRIAGTLDYIARELDEIKEALAEAAAEKAALRAAGKEEAARSKDPVADIMGKFEDGEDVVF
ncbi:hypothetical protein TeGR_g10233 [Tetraparma gracilis]|uniref:Vacuolar ATP synthase subunit D n=1 Tax=Tetraparma gracilis TaxID=2962635 RepID=A0ABQ6MH43_9STRA|nr:hypothetical protein TeGR_g10233 [Tetraparma gracilis]